MKKREYDSKTSGVAARGPSGYMPRLFPPNPEVDPKVGAKEREKIGAQRASLPKKEQEEIMLRSPNTQLTSTQNEEMMDEGYSLPTSAIVRRASLQQNRGNSLGQVQQVMNGELNGSSHKISPLRFITQLVSKDNNHEQNSKKEISRKERNSSIEKERVNTIHPQADPSIKEMYKKWLKEFHAESKQKIDNLFRVLYETQNVELSTSLESFAESNFLTILQRGILQQEFYRYNSSVKEEKILHVEDLELEGMIFLAGQYMVVGFEDTKYLLIAGCSGPWTYRRILHKGIEVPFHHPAILGVSSARLARDDVIKINEEGRDISLIDNEEESSSLDTVTGAPPGSLWREIIDRLSHEVPLSYAEVFTNAKQQIDNGLLNIRHNSLIGNYHFKQSVMECINQYVHIKHKRGNNYESNTSNDFADIFRRTKIDSLINIIANVLYPGELNIKNRKDAPFISENENNEEGSDNREIKLFDGIAFQVILPDISLHSHTIFVGFAKPKSTSFRTEEMSENEFILKNTTFIVGYALSDIKNSQPKSSNKLSMHLMMELKPEEKYIQDENLTSPIEVQLMTEQEYIRPKIEKGILDALERVFEQNEYE